MHDDWNRTLRALIARLTDIVRAHSAHTNGARAEGDTEVPSSGTGEGASPAEVRRAHLDDVAIMWRLGRDRIPLSVWRGERDPEARA